MKNPIFDLENGGSTYTWVRLIHEQIQYTYIYIVTESASFPIAQNSDPCKSDIHIFWGWFHYPNHYATK